MQPTLFYVVCKIQKFAKKQIILRLLHIINLVFLIKLHIVFLPLCVCSHYRYVCLYKSKSMPLDYANRVFSIFFFTKTLKMMTLFFVTKSCYHLENNKIFLLCKHMNRYRISKDSNRYCSCS